MNVLDIIRFTFEDKGFAIVKIDNFTDGTFMIEGFGPSGYFARKVSILIGVMDTGIINDSKRSGQESK